MSQLLAATLDGNLAEIVSNLSTLMDSFWIYIENGRYFVAKQFALCYNLLGLIRICDYLFAVLGFAT